MRIDGWAAGHKVDLDVELSREEIMILMHLMRLRGPVTEAQFAGIMDKIKDLT